MFCRNKHLTHGMVSAVTRDYLDQIIALGVGSFYWKGLSTSKYNSLFRTVRDILPQLHIARDMSVVANV